MIGAKIDFMPNFELVNMIGTDIRIELVRHMTERDQDTILRLDHQVLQPLNAQNISIYISYPKTYPMVLRKKHKIQALIIGMPVEMFSHDETFTEPEMGAKTVFYTAIFCFSDFSSAKILEKEYLRFLQNRKIVHESRHMRQDICIEQGFEVVTSFYEWLVDDKPMCYCKRTLK
jgi:hypothetical protein